MKFKSNIFLAFTFLALSAWVLSCSSKVVPNATDAGNQAAGKVEDAVKDAKDAGNAAAALSNGEVPSDERVRMGQLDNGLRYYIQKNSKPENRAELRLAIDAGAMQEDDDQRGLAHFLEHMCFNGTKNFTKSELVDYLESIGTKFGPDLNAYTSFDETVYMLQVRTDEADMLDKGMLILQDWASNVTMDAEEIEKERGVVMGEHRSGLGASERMRDKWFPVLFKDSRYAERLPIGKPEIIEKAPREAFTRFYKDWYRPDLMAVVVVGDVDVEQMEQQIEERFSNLQNPANPREKVNYDVPKHDETLVAIASDKEAPATQIQILYKHEPFRVNDLMGYRSRIVHSLYNSMLSDRFQEMTEKENPPFLYGFSGYTNFVRNSDAYYGVAGVKPDGVLQGLEAVLLENQRVLQHGFTASELERAKKDMMNNIEKQYKEADKTPSGRLAKRYVSNHLEGTPIPSPKQTFDLYGQFVPSITLMEVNAMAKKWITDKNRVIIVTGPEEEGISMPSEADIRKVLDKADKTQLKAYEDKVSDSPLLAKALKPSTIAATKEIKEIGVREMVLGNGVRVILKPTDFKNDEILLRAFSPGGISLVSDENYMSGSMASTIIDQSGISEFSNTELQKMLTGQTVGVSPFISELSEGFTGSCSPDDFETMLQLVYLYFTEPREDQVVLDNFMTNMKTQFQFLKANPQYYFLDEMYKTLYNDHPRTRFLPKTEELDKVKLDEIMSVYKDRYADASDFTFVLAGNFNPDDISILLAKYLGNLPSINRKETWKDVSAPMPKAPIKKTFVKGETDKSYAQLMFMGEMDWDDAQARYDFYSMIEVLRIKLRERLREDEGGVYGVQVRGSVDRRPREEYSVSISFNAKPEEVDGLVAITKEEIQKIMDNGVEDKDLTKVTETQRQGRIKDLKENNFWVGQLSSYYENDLDPTNLLMEKYAKYVDKLSSEAVQQMTKKTMDLDRVHEFILKPEGKKE